MSRHSTPSPGGGPGPRDELILQAHERLGLIAKKHLASHTLAPCVQRKRLDPDATIVIDAVLGDDDRLTFHIVDHEGLHITDLLDAIIWARQLLWHGTFRPDSPWDCVVVRTPKGIWTLDPRRLARFFQHDSVIWESA